MSDAQQAEENKIGLSLSGGGIRAMIFHLGVCARLLEEKKMWARITKLSTVSGGSLAASFIFTWNESPKWPVKREEYLKVISNSYKFASSEFAWEIIWGRIKEGYLEAAQLFADSRRLIREASGLKAKIGMLFLSAIQAMFFPIGMYFQKEDNFAARFAGKLSDEFLNENKLKALPDNPEWLINALNYESGQTWYLSKNYNYRRNECETDANFISLDETPIGNAVAASAGLPGVLGVTKIIYQNNQISGHQEDENPLEGPYLWDAGIKDNLGTDLFFSLKDDRNLQPDFAEEINFLISSDATSILSPAQYFLSIPITRMPVIQLDRIAHYQRLLLKKKFQEGKHGGFIRIDLAHGDEMEKFSLMKFRFTKEEYFLIFGKGFDQANNFLNIQNKFDDVNNISWADYEGFSDFKAMRENLYYKKSFFEEAIEEILNFIVSLLEGGHGEPSTILEDPPEDESENF